MMDIIYLHGLVANAQIGVWEWEKQITQQLTLDLDMGTDIRISAASDRASRKIPRFLRPDRNELRIGHCSRYMHVGSFTQTSSLACLAISKLWCFHWSSVAHQANAEGNQGRHCCKL